MRQDEALRGEITGYLNELLTDVRVDPGILMQNMCRNRIPVLDQEMLVRVASDNVPVESKAIEWLNGQEIPELAIPWLEEIVEDETRDLELRLRALTLMAENGDDAVIRRISSIVDDWNLGSVSGGAKARFFEAVVRKSGSASANKLATRGIQVRKRNEKGAGLACIDLSVHSGKKSEAIGARFQAMATGDRLDELQQLASEMEAKEVVRILDSSSNESN